jgi:hypothetical protein
MRSGTILQNALGYKPLLMFFMAAWTSSLYEETPRRLYLDSVGMVENSGIKIEKKLLVAGSSGVNKLS